MSTLREHAERYLAMRRALGFKLTTWGPKLMSFIAYLESLEHAVVTTNDALAWATSTPRGSSDSVHWARRLPGPDGLVGDNHPCSAISSWTSRKISGNRW
jgi:integrase/recombinase XerD